MRGVKAKLLRESGIGASRMGQFELDHIVPLALGGHPWRLSNLWLQPWDGPHGAVSKDGLEVRLQRMVCAGEIPLLDAQECIAEDWEACQRRLPDFPVSAASAP
ncbi:MAG: HNH endonuclease [Proteobacteria bacterium]|nr:HNH endonuclease [Pseudomonadota bacterium]